MFDPARRRPALKVIREARETSATETVPTVKRALRKIYLVAFEIARQERARHAGRS